MSERRGLLDRLLGDEPSVETLRQEVARQSERASLAEHGLERAQAALRSARDELVTGRALLGREQKEARLQRERADALAASLAAAKNDVGCLIDVLAELAAREQDLFGGVVSAGFRPAPLGRLAATLVDSGLCAVVADPPGVHLVLSAETAARPGLAHLIAHLVAQSRGERLRAVHIAGLELHAETLPWEDS